MKSYAERHGLNKTEEVKAGEKGKPRELKAKIRITPAEMNGVYKTKLMSTNQLNTLVFNIFRDTCPEVEGVWVDVSGAGVTCDLYISEHPEMDVRAMASAIPLIKRKGDDGARDVMSNIKRFNERRKSSNIYELTDEGKDALSAFISRNNFIGDWKNNNIDWKHVESETCETDIYNRTHRYLKISLDINRVLQAVYGKTSKNGEEYLYCVSPARPLIQQRAQNGNMFVSSWIYSIIQLNHNSLNEIIDESGLGGNTIGSINMYRG